MLPRPKLRRQRHSLAAASLPEPAATSRASAGSRSLPSGLLLAPFYFGDFSSEALQHRPHHRISFKLFAQFLCSGNSARRSRCNCFYFSTHSYRTAQHFARTGTDLFQRVASFHHLRERALVRRKINSQLRAFQFPAAALIHDLSEKFLLGL